jgi:hypothetical protein
MKCANCSDDAKYVYPRAKGFELGFCRKHLPGFLKNQAKLGLLPEASTFDSSKKIEKMLKEQPVVEEDIAVEEPTVEETSSEEE